MKTLIFLMLLPLAGLSQVLKGYVYETDAAGKQQPLPGVNVFWSDNSSGGITDINGRFEINRTPSAQYLIFSFVGYNRDSVFVDRQDEIKMQLKPSITLKEVTIEVREQSTKISTINPINTEIITSKELQKAACCNLSESFETNTTVEVNFTDAVSGAKQIKMLGLDGIYTQILGENIPAIRGLSAAYGLNYIPGTWVESIQVTKGVGSVVNGYESIAGQINVEFLKPENAEKLFVNLYAGDRGRAEANLHIGNKINEKWSTLTFLHGSAFLRKNDDNKDAFLDMPLSRQYNVFNRWKFQGERFMAQFGVKGLIEERESGQVIFDPGSDKGTTNAYGIGINTKQGEFFSKTALAFPGQPYKSLGLISNYRVNNNTSFFGLKNYGGEQQTAYFNLIYQSILGNTLHKIKMGASYLNDGFKESYNDSAFTRYESVPGVFAEYNYDIPEEISVLAGYRMDYHNLYGLIITPRAHLKYNISPLTVVRVSGGRGMRVANIFAENASVFANSREVVVLEKPLPEIAWNYGAGFIKKFNIREREAVLNADVYHTFFENQVVVDLDSDVRKVQFYNLDGTSYSTAAQAEFSYEPVKRFTFKMAYKWQEAYTTYGVATLSRPFISKNRALINLAYFTKFEKWKLDFTIKWFDRSRIPDTSQNPDEYRLNSYSTPYTLLNAQVTRKFKHFEIYLGSENLTNYMQPDPIIASQEPFGTYFDASLIWGPIMGRVIYTGLRYSIK